MSTPVLNLLSNLSEESEAKLTPHKQLRAAGWKKTGTQYDLPQGLHPGTPIHTIHTYTHPEHKGHTIHLNSKTGTFEHKVDHGTKNLKKHLHTHELEAIYAGDSAVAKAHDPRVWR